MTKKRKLPQNYYKIENDYLTVHYVTHDKKPSRVTESIKNTSKTRFIYNTMLKSVLNRGFTRIK